VWLTRGKTLLKLQYPELACGDAYKALQLILTSRNRNLKLTHGVRIEVAKELIARDGNSHILATELMASSIGTNQILTRLDELEYSLVLAQALLMANSFSECLSIIRENVGRFPEAPELKYLRRGARAALAHDISAQEATGHSQQDIEENVASGEAYVESYPWMSNEASRRTDIIHDINDNLTRASREQCFVKKSNIRDKIPVPNPEEREDALEVLGIFAKTTIPGERRVLKDYTSLCAVDDTTRRCSACGNLLPHHPIQQPCCKMKLCSYSCRDSSNTFYHSAVCGKDLDQYDNAKQSPSASRVTVTESRLMLRALAFAVNFSNFHPLQVPIISRLTSPQGGALSDVTHAFSLSKHIIEPIDMLTRLGIDVYANHNFDTWVIQTIDGRLRINSRDNIDDLSSDHYYIAVNPLYTFFNHSCRPNVTYEENKKGPSSTLRMKTTRKIKAGEELFISYISEDLELHVSERQEKLRPWFGHDCQCERCVEEMREQDGEHSEYEDE
jgi:hypothetical protein